MTQAADPLTGLTSAEAQARLEREGFNELPTQGRRPLWRIAAGVMREPMFALLVAAAIVYLLIGDAGEALLLLAFATISVSIAVIQQGRSERALEAFQVADNATDGQFVVDLERVMERTTRELQALNERLAAQAAN